MRRLNVFTLFMWAFGMLCLSSSLNAQLEIPPLSPRGLTSQQVGFMKVEIDYSRPSMRGRTIFGELVPYGKMWRTGANACTKISFSEDVTLEGQRVPAGRYALLTIPGEKEWTIILNKNLKLRGLNGYDAKHDLVRFKVMPKMLDYHFETFTIDVGEVTQTSATLQLLWENTVVRINMGTGADEKIVAQIEEKLNNPMVHIGNTYFGAAAYYLQTHRDMDQAMEWVDKAIEINGDSWSYLHLKGSILAEKGEYRKAIQVGQDAVAAAEKEGSSAGKDRAEASIEKWKSLARSN